mmetsp:Transcript_73896/g.130338  ORF Transcript_73896/g.130338 Transcript_73896/m.130338 type:complete len:253 (+) Transcript_73896:957-1715(+)
MRSAKAVSRISSGILALIVRLNFSRVSAFNGIMIDPFSPCAICSKSVITRSCSVIMPSTALTISSIVSMICVAKRSSSTFSCWLLVFRRCSWIRMKNGGRRSAMCSATSRGKSLGDSSRARRSFAMRRSCDASVGVLKGWKSEVSFPAVTSIERGSIGRERVRRRATAAPTSISSAGMRTVATCDTGCRLGASFGSATISRLPGLAVRAGPGMWGRALLAECALMAADGTAGRMRGLRAAFATAGGVCRSVL